jgi:hypothetical protein
MQNEKFLPHLSQIPEYMQISKNPVTSVTKIEIYANFKKSCHICHKDRDICKTRNFCYICHKLQNTCKAKRILSHLSQMLHFIRYEKSMPQLEPSVRTKESLPQLQFSSQVSHCIKYKEIPATTRNSVKSVKSVTFH